MLPNDPHLTDRDLILAVDGELAPRRAAEVRAHLETCWPCRVREAELQSTIADYVRLHRGSLDAQLPPAAGPRALLKAQIDSWTATAAPTGWLRALIPMAAALSIVFAGTWFMQTHRSNDPLVPKNTVTPGETRTVTVSDVCREAPSEGGRNVPVSLRNKVFEEYGIIDARPGAYEVDYLITPELGGADSIRNLWPQPYSTVWNAHVKDMLEERLHSLVCSGQVDLATAQREIATDWIGAYKKYFHTARPL
jgi:hypothetical protein